MTRRQLAAALLVLVAGRQGSAKTDLPGFLTVDLAQWKGLAVTYKGEPYVLTSEDVWNALRDV